jgi:hypothetical protein
VGNCATRPVSAPRHCAAHSCTANAPHPRRGAGRTLEPSSRDSAGSNRDVRPVGAPSPSLSILCGHPRPCCATPRIATTAPTLLSTRGRDAGTLATAPRMDHCQQLPRARLKTPRSTTTPPPSKSPLFNYRTRHDVMTGARFTRTAVNSAGEGHERTDTRRRTRDDKHETTDSKRSHALRFPTILALASITSFGTWRPRLLSHLTCSHPSTGTPVRSNTVPRAHPCWTYGPGRNQDKPSVLSCLAPIIEKQISTLITR